MLRCNTIAVNEGLGRALAECMNLPYSLYSFHAMNTPKGPPIGFEAGDEVASQGAVMHQWTNAPIFLRLQV